MSKKEFKISAKGLKNIIFNSSVGDDDFIFIIGNQEVRTKKFFADFISPRISRIHQTDPTIDSFCINDYVSEQQRSQISEIFPIEIIHKFETMMVGDPIEVDSATSQKLLSISIILDNPEIYEGMGEIYPLEFNDERIDNIIQYLQLFENTDNTFSIFNGSKFYDSISSNFYRIDESKLLQLPKTVIHSIISNEHLRVKSEDSLFDFINKLFENENDANDRISFYEKIYIKNLSENKLSQFLDSITSSEITSNLWENLKKVICPALSGNDERDERYSYVIDYIKVKFDGNSSNRFKGIISHLGNGNAKSAFDNKTIDITAATYTNGFNPFKALEYDNNNYYHSKDDSSYMKEGHTEWLRVDFKERKVRPSHYSIKSYEKGKNSYNLQNWVLEGSNDGESWNILDTRNGEKSLDDSSASNTFEVNNKKQFYRYLQIRQTGPNCTNNDYRLIIKSLEYFGLIK